MSTIKVDTYLTRGGASEIAIDKLKGVTAAGSMLVVAELVEQTLLTYNKGWRSAWYILDNEGGTVIDNFNGILLVYR